MGIVSAILGFLGRVLTPVLLFFGGRASKSAQNAQATAAAAAKGNRIREDVRSLSDDAIDDGLRRYRRNMRESGNN